MGRLVLKIVMVQNGCIWYVCTFVLKCGCFDIRRLARITLLSFLKWITTQALTNYITVQDKVLSRSWSSSVHSKLYLLQNRTEGEHRKALLTQCYARGRGWYEIFSEHPSPGRKIANHSGVRLNSSLRGKRKPFTPATQAICIPIFKGHQWLSICWHKTKRVETKVWQTRCFVYTDRFNPFPKIVLKPYYQYL